MQRSSKVKELIIFVLSDGTGETAERMVRSALIQFEGAPVQIVRKEHVRTPKRVSSVVREAAVRDALILHTLVSTDLRRYLLTEARIHGLDSIDLLGPIMDRLAIRLKQAPLERPGVHGLLFDESRRREIEAVDFAFRHDDGQHPEDLESAEIVLVGVSRTMKTPTMLYLAYRGWFAANVPLIMEVSPPEELLALPPALVFWLDIDPYRLLEWRKSRAFALKIPVEPYATLSYIRKELIHVKGVCHKNKWRRIDVTGKSVEEVAREILLLRSV